MFDDLAGGVAVVTGGARGIGYAVADGLAGLGAHVVLVDVLPQVGESAQRLAAERGVRTAGLVADVTDAGRVARVLADAADRVGEPTVLVNCAGVASVVPALDVDLAEWERVFRVNVTGTFLTCQAFARACRDRGRGGAIVNIASMSARVVNVPQRQAAYNASKAAVEALTRSLAVEWLELGVRVNAVSPGYVLSDQTRGTVEAEPQTAAFWRSRIPAGDLAQPGDLVGAVAYLASSASRYVVGQSLVVDGGYTLL